MPTPQEQAIETIHNRSLQAQGISNTPAAPTPPAPSIGQKIGSAAKTVGNFFENLGKSVVNSTVSMAKTTGRVINAGIGEVKLAGESYNEENQAKAIAAGVKAASLLPTKAQRRSALSKIGTPTQFIQQSDIDKVDAEYNAIGLTNHDSMFTTIRKGGSDIATTAFGISTVVDPLAGGLKSIASDAISGALVKVGLKDAAGAVTEGVAKTVGESIIKDAGENTARVTVRVATQEGKQVLASTATKKLLGGMVNAGIVNSALSTVDQWSKGNNFDTPQQITEAAKSAGLAFVQGAAIAGVAESVPYGIGKYQDSKVLADVNTRLGTNYSGEMGAELAKTMNEMRDTYSGVVQQSRLQDISDNYDKQVQETRNSNLQKAREAKVVNSINKAKASLSDLVSKTPSVQSYDEAVQNLTTNHGMDMTVAKPEDQALSGVKGNKVTIQKGNFPDYLKQVGTFVASKLKDNGVSLTAFKGETDSIPDSGTAELDTPQAKISRVMGELNGENAQAFRTKYPNIASAFDAIHGVVKPVTPSEAAQAFVRNNLPEHFNNIESVIEREAITAKPNPVTGATELSVDPAKKEKMWLDAQDLIIKGRGDTKVMNAIKTTVEKSNEISTLRSAAQAAGDTNPMLAQAFDKADKAISSVKSLDDKIQMWNQHLDIFKIAKPDIKSPLETAPPLTDTSTTGLPNPSGGEIKTSGSSDVGAKQDLRPQHQAQIEDAMKNGDYKKAWNIVDSIPESDPYKQSMQSMLDATHPKSEVFPEEAQATTSKSKLATYLESLGSEELPGFNKETHKEELGKAASIVVNDYQKAVKMALGTEPIDPSFKDPSSAKVYLAQAVLKQAIDTGDTATISAVSAELTPSVTSAAKTLSAVRTIYSDTETGWVQKAQLDRAEAMKAKTGDITTGTKELTESVKSSALKDEETPGLIDQLTCK
jgi:hypothetical protein